MGKGTRYSAEYKTEAVRLYKESGKSVERAAGDIGIAKMTLTRWVKQSEIDEGKGPVGALTTEERAELIRLRRENRRVTAERDFLKKVSAFFARESSGSRTK